jgi:hypothetical protein
MMYLGDTTTKLAGRLHDPGMVFWSGAELQRIILEAMRFWNVLTGFNRKRYTFTMAAQSIPWSCFLDMRAYLPGFALKDAPAGDRTGRDIYNDVQRRLIEPPTPTGGAWTGSDQFTPEEIYYAITHRTTQFLYETGVNAFELQVPYLDTTAGGRIDIQNHIPAGTTPLQILRVVWVTPEGKFIPLTRDDSRAGHLSRGRIQSHPDSYSLITASPTTMHLYPAPTDRGQMNIILSRASSQTFSPIEDFYLDDFETFVLWGAVADLLSKDGQAYDPQRAAVAEQLFRMGVEAVKLTPSVLDVEINGSPVIPTSAYALDYGRPGWDGELGRPEEFALVSPYRYTLCPRPAAATSVTVEYVSPVSLPPADSMQLNMGDEMNEPILSLATFFASFKLGLYEIYNAKRLFDNALQQALVYNRKLDSTSVYKDFIYGVGSEQRRYRPLESGKLAEESLAVDEEMRREVEQERRSRSRGR